MNPFTSTNPESGLFSSLRNSNQGSNLFSLFQSGPGTAGATTNPSNTSGGLFSSTANPFQSSEKKILFPQQNPNLFSNKLSKSEVPQSSEVESKETAQGVAVKIESLPEVSSTTVIASDSPTSPRQFVRKPLSSPGSFHQKAYLQRRLSKDKESPSKLLAIKILKIPVKWDKSSLVAHFKKFGKIVKSIFYEEERKFIVYFSDPKSALNAKSDGSKTDDGDYVGEIFYHLNRNSLSGTRQNTSATFKNVSSQNLCTDVASVVANKLTLLESRDKALRLKIGKKGSRESALVGMCQDMCSEKERYFREKAQEISVYECDPLTNSPDHRRFVTNYSRSSADQEEPLPSDLRTPQTLKRAMLYLLAAISDLGESQEEEAGKLGRWFEFLWSRTRAIRKEITQQQLCDLNVVSILEKITRFHIYCSERLCEEDSHSFDPKINNDNLTKCLQTLREMYQDLQLNSSYSPNEPEFRAYMILTKLDDDSILNEVHLLPKTLRASSQVTFAMDTYHCLRTNNYVRFFKMVDKADYLSACLLHRYFSRIRLKALEVMIKAYSLPSKGSSALPLELLCNHLKFENIPEAQEFCTGFSLSVDALDNLFFERSTRLQVPDGPLPNSRAVQLIESKRGELSVGEVLNGEALSPVESYIQPVHNSFDTNGQLKDHSVEVIDLTETPSSTSDDAIFSMQESAIRDQFNQLLEECVQSVSKDVCQEVCLHHSTAVDVFHQTLREVCVTDSTHIAHQVLHDYRLYLEEEKPLHDCLLQQVIRETLCAVVREEMTVCEQEDNQLRDCMSGEGFEDILSDCIRECATDQLMVAHIWKEESESSVANIQQLVIEEELFDLTATFLLQEFKKRRHFRIWRRVYANLKANRDALYNMSSGPAMVDDFVMGEDLLGAVNLDVRLGSKKARLSGQHKLQEKSSFELEKSIEDDSLLMVWSPLFESVTSFSGSSVVMVLPSQLSASTRLWYCWLRMKVKHCEVVTVSVDRVEQFSANLGDSPSLWLCFLCSEGRFDLKSRSELIYCLAINCAQKFKDKFIPSNVVSFEIPCEEKPSVHWNILLESQLNSLLHRVKTENNQPNEPFVQTVLLRDFVEEFFQNNFYSPVSQDYRCRIGKHLPHHNINSLIEAYNRVVNRLAKEMEIFPEGRQLVLELLLPLMEFSSSRVSEIIASSVTWMNESHVSMACLSRCFNLLNSCRRYSKKMFMKEMDSFPWTDIIALCTNDRLSRSNLISIHGSKELPIDLLWRLDEKPLSDLLSINDSPISGVNSAAPSDKDNFHSSMAELTCPSPMRLTNLQHSRSNAKSFEDEMNEIELEMSKIRESISKISSYDPEF